jgi:hypothetical protein
MAQSFSPSHIIVSRRRHLLGGAVYRSAGAASGAARSDEGKDLAPCGVSSSCCCCCWCWLVDGAGDASSASSAAAAAVSIFLIASRSTSSGSKMSATSGMDGVVSTLP